MGLSNGFASAVALTAAFTIGAGVLRGEPPAVEVRFVTDEPEAVLDLLDKRAAREEIGDPDWRRLFATDGWLRLKKREEGMGGP